MENISYNFTKELGRGIFLIFVSFAFFFCLKIGINCHFKLHESNVLIDAVLLVPILLLYFDKPKVVSRSQSQKLNLGFH